MECWSIIYMLLTKKAPFNGKNDEIILEKNEEEFMIESLKN